MKSSLCLKNNLAIQQFNIWGGDDEVQSQQYILQYIVDIDMFKELKAIFQQSDLLKQSKLKPNVTCKSRDV